MTRQEIDLLVKSLATKGEAELVETHISWVILTSKYVYKFKKPMRYSFLNYSKLIRRKYYCEREIELNSRYSDIYLEIVHVSKTEKGLRLGEEGEIIDYAVKMKRIDHHYQMDVMLQENSINTSHIMKLALKIAGFHRDAEIIREGFSPREMSQRFGDIRSIKPFLFKELGVAADQQINEAILDSNHFVNSNINLFEDREKYGFVRDLHGDLHAKNIFIANEPILFDCIEFNDQFRQIDVLNEIAFLCMDLEAKGRADLAKNFLKTYLSALPVMSSLKEEKLFAFYKCYRANVRAKVNALRARQAESLEEKKTYLRTVKDYLDLMTSYTYDFNGISHVSSPESVLEHSQLSA